VESSACGSFSWVEVERRRKEGKVVDSQEEPNDSGNLDVYTKWRS